MRHRFRDRTEAGRALAPLVLALDLPDPVVLGLPRGGVPVAREVAAALGAPLDVLVVRKVGAPGRREFAVGAIGEGDVEVLHGDTLRQLGLDRDAIGPIVAQERAELARRVARYRGGAAPLDVTGRDVVLVDDGLATGASAAAAAQVLRARSPRSVVLAVPVAAPAGVASLERLVDRVVVVHAPRDFAAVGQFYDDFGQVTDEQVQAILSAPGAA